MLLSLITTYRDIQEATGDLIVSKTSQEFSDIKVNVALYIKTNFCNALFSIPQELAKRFALSLGMDAIKNREAVIALHRAGILFAVTQDDSDNPMAAPVCLPFLEILNEFTNKLLKQDKRVVYVFNCIVNNFQFKLILFYCLV